MFIDKYLSHYVGTRSVFILNLFISVIASFVVFCLMNYASGNLYDTTFELVWMSSAVVASIVPMMVFKSYKIVIRHSSLRDFIVIAIEIASKGMMMLIILAIAAYLHLDTLLALICDVSITFALALLSRIAMILVYDAYKAHIAEPSNGRMRIFVFGTSDKSVAAITRLQNSSTYQVAGLLAPNIRQHFTMNNLTVYSYQDFSELKRLMLDMSISGVLFASEDDAREQENGLLGFCLKNKFNSLVIPSVEEVAAGKLMKRSVRNVKIEDLLGRSEIKLSMEEIHNSLKGKTIMVTGAAGSIGSELCRQLAGFDVKKIVLFDNAETPMYYIRLELEERFPYMKFVPIIGDVRSVERLDFAFRENRPDVVFHAAAYKHVPLMEENPCEAVLVNVNGSRNVADKCVEYNVEKMVMISTDKAVNPTNIMGCSKRLAEIYVQSLALAIEQGKVKGCTKFVTTRFGNVLGSNGSVIPRFREQIEKGGPVTVTHPEINRYFMTIPEACRLVMEAAAMGIPNRIFVFDMGQPVKIVDLAKRMIELSGLKLGTDIEIEFTGLRPGEKLFEEVLAATENTDPTSHNRIRIAHIREYEYEYALEAVNRLAELSASAIIPEMVILMKQVVPEFKSQNSRFAEYDK